MDIRAAHWQHAKRIAKAYGLGRAVTFWRAATAAPQATQDWVQFVATHLPESEHEGMVMRPLRPYMRQHFDVNARREMLQEHYTNMAQHFASPERLRGEPGREVVTLTGKGDVKYRILLGGNTSKEGELAFGLYDELGQYLAKLAVTLGRDEQGQLVLWLGGLQGAKPPLGRDEVVKATRDLYGMRPKGAIMLAAQAFARLMAAEAIRAPGNEGHISQRGFRRLRKKRMIYADYGQFWEEIGGTKLGAEEYSIPVIPLVRDVNEVKPNKRSEWKKRQALAEQIAVELTAVLGGV